MKSLDEYMAFYSEIFEEPSSKLIQKACSVIAFFCIVALLWSISFYLMLVAAIAAIGFYFSMSPKTAIAGALSIGIAWALQMIIAFSSIFLIIFLILAVVGQMHVQKNEGEKFNFIENLKFQLLGPLWTLGPRNLRMFDLY